MFQYVYIDLYVILQKHGGSTDRCCLLFFIINVFIEGYIELKSAAFATVCVCLAIDH